MNNFQFSIFNFQKRRGYTLIELVVAVGLFALIMMLASGAYLVMIGINRQVQATATGINNLSFALETMTRTIRTGTDYGCPTAGTNCSGGAVFSVINSSGNFVEYVLSAGGTITRNGVDITDPSPSVKVTSLLFYAIGTSPSDDIQAHVTIVAEGFVSAGHGEIVPFSVETGATMRGSDI